MSAQSCREPHLASRLTTAAFTCKKAGRPAEGIPPAPLEVSRPADPVREETQACYPPQYTDLVSPVFDRFQAEELFI